MLCVAAAAALAGCASTEPGQKIAAYDEPAVSVASRIPRKDPNRANGVVQASKEELENARLIGGSAINGMDAAGR